MEDEFIQNQERLKPQEEKHEVSNDKTYLLENGDIRYVLMYTVYSINIQL